MTVNTWKCRVCDDVLSHGADPYKRAKLLICGACNQRALDEARGRDMLRRPDAVIDAVIGCLEAKLARAPEQVPPSAQGNLAALRRLRESLA